MFGALRVVVGVLAMILMVRRAAFDAERRFAKLWLLLPFTVAVRLVAKRAAEIPVHPHGPVATIAVHGTARRVGWNQAMVDAQATTLRIAIRE